MYKGFLIKQIGNKLQAKNLETNVFLNPLYKTFENLKLIIDNIK